MSRDDLQHIRDRLLQLAEASSGQRRPLNVKRKVTLSRQASKAGPGPKLSVQDFVRMDPGYTPDIEHLVFPNPKKRSPQQVAPAAPPPAQPPATKTRSRLAEMFALSRHLQRSSTERQEVKNKGQSQVTRSMDSATNLSMQGRQSSVSNNASKRWVYSVDETVRQNSLLKNSTRVSPPSAVDNDKSINRGPNVSILHLRSTSEPWDKGPPTSYSSAAARSYFAASRGATTLSIPTSVPPLIKHQSLGSSTSSGTPHKWTNSPSFHSGSEVNSPGIFTFSGSVNRELSPVRWCDREVDGVYLGKSGWVQVQQKSLEDSRRTSYSVNLAKSLQSRRTGVKLANYHFHSEPSKRAENSRTSSVESQIESRNELRSEQRPEPRVEPRTEARPDPQRPAYLLLQNRDFDRKVKTPSPLPDPGSPPSITPIISPPPAFQDKTKSPVKSRAFFGKTPFLPRSNAIEDSDNSPPASPPAASMWKTTAPNAPILSKPKPVIKTSPGIEKPPRAVKKVPQAKSLEDTTASRRMQFKHQYGSSSSSSSSMGFRSLDSCLNRTSNVMPRLSENTDSSVDIRCEDADEEDNNSSSVNISMVNPALLQAEYSRKLSPSGRVNRLTHYRNQLRRSPAGSDSNKHSPTSSSSSSNEFLSRSPPSPQQQTMIRRNAASRPFQPVKSPQDDSLQRVRRSRSLQLPERQPPSFDRSPKVSPQYHEPHKVAVKAGTIPPQQERTQFSQQPDRTQFPQQSDRTQFPQQPDRTQYPSQPDRSQYPAQSDRTQYPPQPERSQYPISGKTVSVDRGELLQEELLREAEVVTGFLYGNRSRAAAQALLMHRYNNNISMEERKMEANKPTPNNELTIYYVGNNKNDRQRVLLRGATSPSLPSSKNNGFDAKNNYPGKGPCNPETCAFWPHCAHRESLNRESLNRESLNREAQFGMRSSQSYPSHQMSLDSATTSESGRSVSTVIDRKAQDQYQRRLDMDNRTRKPQEFRRISPSRPPATGGSIRRNGSTEMPVIEKKSSPRASNVSGSSSGSDVWLTASRVSSIKGSGASTPVEGFSDKDRTVLSRPGSAPTEEVPAGLLVSQQRSMSLPKSFLSGVAGVNVGAVTGDNGMYLHSGQVPWPNQGTASLSSSPGFPRKLPTPEAAQTAPVTPLHEGRRGRSPLGAIRRAKANSTPHLSEHQGRSRKWNDQTDDDHEFSLNPSGSEETALNKNHPAPTTESVLQKFRKTFSLRFPQRKSSKDSCASEDTASAPSEEESSPQHVTSATSSGERIGAEIDEDGEGRIGADQRYRFGPLIWRTSKERKKLKAARNAKCNSGDSGIQIEMPGGCGGTGDSSESHDTDGPPFDSPPVLRRKPPGRTSRRPYSDLVSVGATDKFKTDLKQQQQLHCGPRQVRRTRSDLGGQRLLGWEQRQAARRLLRNMASPRRPLSPRKRPPDENDDGAVVLRRHAHGAPPRRPALRRSLSQPIDIDKLSPLMITKFSGNRAIGPNTVLSEDDQDNRVASGASNTSDEDTMSDSDVSSIASFSDRKKSLGLPGADDDMMVLAEAVFDHVAIEADELAFRAGDVVEVEDTADREWWWGSTNGKSGWFPAQFVRLRVSQEDTVEDCLAAIASGRPVSSQIRRRTSISLLSNDQVRTSVVRELVHTERDFVKVLRDVAEGYVSECRKRTDMFSNEQIATIFINVEDILKFQIEFLKDLEGCINWEAPHKSCVGECFLKHSAGFKMYSDYCNSHPMATATLQELYQFNNYSKFFEACRLMRGLIEIPLDGYLLTPVQRICKYPLQLAELLKYTRYDHEDYGRIKEALHVMRGVAMLINERKRRMESLEKLAAWQQRVDGWEGEDLIELSSQLIYQGDVVRVTTGMWTNSITLFLFDHQIVYCKKDILKRNTYVYKGRICLDTSEIIDVPDGKDSNLNVSVRHGIKLLNVARDKWLIFCCRSAKEKQRWLDAFREERRLVAKDKNDGLDLPPASRHLARVAAFRQRRPPRKLRHGKNLKQDTGYIGSSLLQLNVASSNSHSLLSRKMGTWFNFGAGKKSRHHHDLS